MWYTGKFDEGPWQFFGILALDTHWLRARGRGTAAIGQTTQ